MDANKEKELVPFVILSRYYNTTLTNKYKNRKVWENPVAGEIKSNLPGTILSLDVKVGDKVEKGDLLLIHEAMKMKNRILAPFSGVIESISVEEGEKIKKDVLMVKIKPINE